MERITSKRKPRKCAKCGSPKIVKIMYGYPSEDAFKTVEEGKIVLGGCCITNDDPSWQCAGCGVKIYKEKQIYGKLGINRKPEKKISNRCSICNTKLANSDEDYPNLVCEKCDKKAVSENNIPTKYAGDDPLFKKVANKIWTDENKLLLPDDNGDNPVYIGGKKCWRRYRFGGWVTMYDPDNFSTLEEFFNKHFKNKS